MAVINERKRNNLKYLIESTYNRIEKSRKSYQFVVECPG